MQPAKRDGSAEGGEREMIADGFLKAKTTRHARFLYIFSLFLCSSAQGTSSLSSRKRGQSSRQPERTRLAHSQTAVFFFFFSCRRRSVAGRRRFCFVRCKLGFFCSLAFLSRSKKDKRLVPWYLLAPPRARCAGAGVEGGSGEKERRSSKGGGERSLKKRFWESGESDS